MAKAPTSAQARKPSLRDRFDALRNLPPFLRQIWATSPSPTVATLGLRIVRVHRYLIGKFRELADKLLLANRALTRRRAFRGASARRAIIKTRRR